MGNLSAHNLQLMAALKFYCCMNMGELEMACNCNVTKITEKSLSNFCATYIKYKFLLEPIAQVSHGKVRSLVLINYIEPAQTTYS